MNGSLERVAVSVVNWKETDDKDELARIAAAYPVLKPLIDQKRVGDQLWLLCLKLPDTPDAQASVSLDLLKSIVSWRKRVSALLSPHQNERSQWNLPISTSGGPNMEHSVTEEVGRRLTMLKEIISQIAEGFAAE